MLDLYSTESKTETLSKLVPMWFTPVSSWNPALTFPSVPSGWDEKQRARTTPRKVMKKPTAKKKPRLSTTCSPCIDRERCRCQKDSCRALFRKFHTHYAGAQQQEDAWREPFQLCRPLLSLYSLFYQRFDPSHLAHLNSGAGLDSLILLHQLSLCHC
ncbi:unnamed protein product [Lepidochelys kempii]